MNLSSVSAAIGTAAPSGESVRQLRAQREQLEVRLRAVEFSAAELARDLAALEGFSLAAALGSLTGTRQARVEAIRARAAELEAHRAEVEAELCAVEARLAEVGSDAMSLAAETAAPAAAEALPAGDAVQIARKAVEAIDEAICELRQQQEIVSTLGRCNVANVRATRFIINASRENTVKDCAASVRRALARGVRLAGAAIDLPLAAERRELAVLFAEAAAWSESFSGDWLKKDARGAASADHVLGQLQVLSMLLEKLSIDLKHSRSA